MLKAKHQKLQHVKQTPVLHQSQSMNKYRSELNMFSQDPDES